MQIPEDEIKQEEEDEEVECSKDHGDGLCGCEPCGNVRVSAVEEESDVEHDLTRKVRKNISKYWQGLQKFIPTFPRMHALS